MAKKKLKLPKEKIEAERAEKLLKLKPSIRDELKEVAFHEKITMGEMVGVLLKNRKK